jgi:hypothetical protein
MFETRNVTATLPVPDLARAIEWYRISLDISPTETYPNGMGAVLELTGVHAIPRSSPAPPSTRYSHSTVTTLSLTWRFCGSEV